MAAVKSLGIHEPSALPYLIQDGLLPQDPPPSLYSWQISSEEDVHQLEKDEELLTTETCVVWSRGGSISRIFRFEVEKEPIVKAVFVRFPQQQQQIGIKTERNSITADQPIQTKSQLSVRKRATANAPDTIPRPNLQAPSLSKETQNQTRQHIADEDSHYARALVVVLRTQAQIFFLSGTNHIVHLPFEVSNVFPLHCGLILQRKATSLCRPEQSLNLPALPLPSHINSSWCMPTSQKIQGVGDFSESDTPPLFISLFKAINEDAYNARDSPLPFHFYLGDPLTEVAPLAVSRPGTFHESKPLRYDFKLLGKGETIIYASKRSEISEDVNTARLASQVMLVVTFNQEKSQYNVWQLSTNNSDKFWRPGRYPSKGTNGGISRRRSSYASVTGNNTPALRSSIGPRESLGAYREQAHHQNQLQDDVELAAQLDPAFEDPAAPARRRISSLFARSDLANNRDPSSYPDLFTGFNQRPSVKRGVSFGGLSTRTSFGSVLGSHHQSRVLNGTLHHDHNTRSFLSMAGERVPGIFESEDARISNNLLKDDQGLRHELYFSLIYSVPRDAAATTSNNPMTNFHVLTLSPPVNHGSIPEVMVCLMDRSSQSLVVLKIEVVLDQSSLQQRSGLNGAFTTKVTDVHHGKGILDACRIGIQSSSRLVVLARTPDGFGEITIQSPWSTLLKIQLPATLMLSSPFRLCRRNRNGARPENGPKRVLSGGVRVLSALRSSTGNNQIDVIDQDMVRHRLELQVLPRSGFIRRLIRVCEAVLPRTNTEHEPILRAWWDAMAWLRDRSENHTDPEWTAFVLIIFSMFVDGLEEQGQRKPLRKPRRKAGLLRSISGTSADLESFDSAMIYESKASSVSPIWMNEEGWAWTSEGHMATSVSGNRASRSGTATVNSIVRNTTSLIDSIALARDFSNSNAGRSALGEQGYLPIAASKPAAARNQILPTMLLGLHLFREELKLDILASLDLHRLTPILAQIGTWFSWSSWGSHESSFYMLENLEMSHWVFDESKTGPTLRVEQTMDPPSIFEHIEKTVGGGSSASYLTLSDIVRSNHDTISLYNTDNLTPRTHLVLNLLKLKGGNQPVADQLTQMFALGLDMSILETLPEGIAAIFRSTITICQSHPPAELTPSVLSMIGRDDISMLQQPSNNAKFQTKAPHSASPHDAGKDYHTLCTSILEADQVGSYDGTAELDRAAITRMVFKEDQRFTEAAMLVHPLKAPVVRCVQEPDWSDTDLLEAQQEMATVIAIRTLSVSSGRGMLYYNARLPLLTERFPIHGFTLSSVMKPGNTTVTADRNIYTEEKVSWAFFHAGVEAGLSISRKAKGIDTSWILFNKPPELNNRHAGFLLALGLNGHLKSIAKWVAFKYLTPKHTMTSIGLLLGLAASYLGTMDTLITRLLSVHVTRMLPPGAAELNLSPLTQTTGIMAIGLLYCNTQHRRMAEVMLSEMENTDQDDNTSPMENLRDEGYRLAAGFALGYINLGQGNNLKGLHDMHIVERLLALVVSTKRVQLVHILDKATAAATVAIALIFMKTENEALAKKIDIPDTAHQFEYVRPDIFLLRTVARHLIMWSRIVPSYQWLRKQLPVSFLPKAKLTTVKTLSTEDLPLYNTIAGLCLSIGLRFAGTARQDVRDLLGHYLDQFMRICRLPALDYDSKLTRTTVRNCQDTVALAAASVMAGTGDIYLFRRLRALHGRTDPDIPFGSHLAAHQAVGVLFLGGGTHTFNTSNIAVASLLCAFYPLFPSTVLDNKSHLQAYRHFWVLATEPRCLIARDVNTHRPVSIPIIIVLRSGKELEGTAPCLLPELDTIQSVCSNDNQYWRVTLDFKNNPAHLEAFKSHQSIYVRRRGAYDASSTAFSSTMQALNDASTSHELGRQALEWIFKLQSFQEFDRSEMALVLTSEASLSFENVNSSTAIDDRLSLARGCFESGKAERLWNLRILFTWAEGVRRDGGEMGWFRREVIEMLSARVGLLGWTGTE